MKTRHLFSDNHATMSMTSKLRGGDEAHRALVCRVATVTSGPRCLSRGLRGCAPVRLTATESDELLEAHAACHTVRAPACCQQMRAANGCSAQTSAQSFNGIRTQGDGSVQVLATKQRAITPRNAVILAALGRKCGVCFAFPFTLVFTWEITMDDFSQQ